MLGLCGQKLDHSSCYSTKLGEWVVSAEVHCGQISNGIHRSASEEEGHVQ